METGVAQRSDYRGAQGGAEPSPDSAGPRLAPRLCVLAPLFLLALLGACGAERDQGEAAGKKVTVNALAGTALRDVLSEAGAAFERSHPRVRIDFHFEHIPELLRALDQGMAADLFVAHDEDSIQHLLRTGRAAGQPRIISRSRLVIVVPVGNPKRVSGLADLERPGMVVLSCRPELPCGRAAERVRRVTGLRLSGPVVDGGPAIVTKVSAGEADAGLAFVTEVHAGDTKVSPLPIPEHQEAVLDLPAVVLDGARHPREAAAFLDFLSSEAGTAIFERHGFLAP